MLVLPAAISPSRPLAAGAGRLGRRDKRRRLGGPFTAVELADLYGRGTDWCLELAVTTAPDDPRAWDAQTAADAAFARYVREAADYAGGRRVGESA